MMNYLRLIRWPNLLIIAFTMIIIRYCFIVPFIHHYGLELQFSTMGFILLMLSTLLIAAGGYVINDYFDHGADEKNKPGKIIIEVHISRSKALWFYIILTLGGLISGTYISASIGHHRLAFIFALVAGLLWFYSDLYKKQVIVGNLIIASMAAMVPFIVFIFDMTTINIYFKEFMLKTGVSLGEIWRWTFIYMIFAFLLTLIREILKDTEDYEGDKISARETIPLTFGINTSKTIVYILISLLLIALFIAYRLYMADPLSMVYLVGFVMAPLIFILLKLKKANSAKDYRLLSSICKAVMVTGLGYGLLARYLIESL